MWMDELEMEWAFHTIYVTRKCDDIFIYVLWRLIYIILQKTVERVREKDQAKHETQNT